MDIHSLVGNYLEQQMVVGMQMQRRLELQDLLIMPKEVMTDMLHWKLSLRKKLRKLMLFYVFIM